MSSRRLEKLNSLIRGELASIIKREIDFPDNVLVTITQCQTSADVRFAKVKISVIPKEKSFSILKILERKIFYLQQILNKRLHLRYVPKIKFEIDKSEELIERIEEISRRLK